jgi:hypothetical protein
VAKFSQVEAATYSDEHYVRLSVHARLLFLWAWGNERAGIGALYPVSPRQICRAFAELRDPEHLREVTTVVERTLDELSAVPPTGKPLVLYDWDAEVLWVPGRAGKANRSPLTRKGIRNEYERCPASPLKAQFAERYPDIVGEAT